MRMSLGRAVIAAACLMWLAGCETTSTPDNPFVKLGGAATPPSGASDSDTTGSVLARDKAGGMPPLTPELLGADPNDDLSIGKKYFRQGSYGLAERHFRKAVELHPRDAESWVGLAASYDRLKRFDLADRAYAQAIKMIGATPEVMNNQGFSYMLRGDYRRARSDAAGGPGQGPEESLHRQQSSAAGRERAQGQGRQLIRAVDDSRLALRLRHSSRVHKYPRGERHCLSGGFLVRRHQEFRRRSCERRKAGRRFRRP